MVINEDTGTKEESSILTDFYLVREFSDSEIRLLIDSLLFSSYLPYNQCKELVSKLECLSSDHFRQRVKYVYDIPRARTDNQELFYSLDVIDEAIAQEKQVRFVYNGSEMLVSPYQMMIQKGEYLLLCNLKGTDDTSMLRLDKVKDVQKLNARARSYGSLNDSRGQAVRISDYQGWL